MGEKKKKEPATLLSVANVITVLLIILATATTRLGDESLFRRLLFAFHMPLFFILSGMILDKHKGEGRKLDSFSAPHIPVPCHTIFYLGAYIFRLFLSESGVDIVRVLPGPGPGPYFEFPLVFILYVHSQDHFGVCAVFSGWG